MLNLFSIKKIPVKRVLFINNLLCITKSNWEVQRMPNIKSSKKRVLVNVKKATINKAHKTNLRTKLKIAKLNIENKAENATTSVQDAIITIDKAVSKGLLHKNAAARKKSRLMSNLKKI